MSTNKFKEVTENAFGENERLKQILFLITGMILSGVNFMGFNPIGVSFFCSLSMYQGMGMISAVSMAIGMTESFLFVDALKYIVVLMAATIVFKILVIGNLKLKDVPSTFIYSAIFFAMEVTDYAMKNSFAKPYTQLLFNMLVIVGISGLAGVMFYLFRKTFRIINEQKMILSNIEMLGLTLTIGFSLYGLYIRNILPVEGTILCIFLFVIYETYKRGLSMGALMGAACGIPLCVVNGYEQMWMSYIGIVCALGILIGISREFGKIIVLAVTLGYGLMGAYLIFPDFMNVETMKGLLGAVTVFMMLPKSIVYRIEENVNTEEIDGIKNICEERLMDIAKTFDRISKTMFSDAAENDEEEMINVTGEELIEKIWKNKFAESRMIMSNQFEQIAKIIEEYSKQMYDFVKITDEQEEYIRNRLKSKKIYLDKIVGIENKRQRNEYLVTAKCEKGVTIGSRDVAEIISEAMGKTYMPSKNCRKLISNEYTTTTYVEAANFYVMHAAAGKARGESGISGDNYSLKELDNGQLLMGLSDGMGYGTSACLESETVIELLEQLLDSGFDADTAMKMINSVMVMNSNEDHPATLDYGVIDLHSGVCDIVKIGAAATFVKRGNWVETIKSTSMPLGIFSELDYDSTSKKLYDGDMIIMVSDGIIDAMESDNKDEIMGKIISSIKSENPKEIADKILETALKGREKLNDDMTVLVTGIWENKKKVA